MTLTKKTIEDYIKDFTKKNTSFPPSLKDLKNKDPGNMESLLSPDLFLNLIQRSKVLI